MAALFNSVSTIDNHYAMLVNHDFHSGPYYNDGQLICGRME